MKNIVNIVDSIMTNIDFFLKLGISICAKSVFTLIMKSIKKTVNSIINEVIVIAKMGSTVSNNRKYIVQTTSMGVVPTKKYIRGFPFMCG
jgi:hypothetical protein